jgi:hypothetical protein
MVGVEMDLKVAGAIVAMGRKRERGFSFGDWVVRREWGREVREIKL